MELVSDSTRQSEIIRGEADARRNNIFAAAYGADPEFFEFYRSMTAYERALGGETTRMVLSPDSEFFTFLQAANPRSVDLEAAAAAAAEGIEALDLPSVDDLEGVPSVDEMPNADTLREEVEESAPELAPDPEG